MVKKSKKTKASSKSSIKNSSKSKSKNNSKDRITHHKSSIHLPIEENEAPVEYEDNYNLLDMTIGEARKMPEFETLFHKNCNSQLSTRMDTLIKSDVSLNKYTNDESKTYCKCCLTTLNKYKIRDILDVKQRDKLKLYDCVFNAFTSVKTRITNKKKSNSKSNMKKTIKNTKNS